MSEFRLLELPTALRDYGLDPLEAAGWQTRGKPFPAPPRGSTDHWTGSRAYSGDAPSLSVVLYGRPGLTGPLANVLRTRRTLRPFIIASGKANHAGVGLWTGSAGTVSSNYHLCGLEVEQQDSSEHQTDEALDVDARIHAAFGDLCGFAPDMTMGHWEYGRPRGRKIDRKNIGGQALRERVATVKSTPATTQGAEVGILVQPIDDKHPWYLVGANTRQKVETTEEAKHLLFQGRITVYSGKTTDGVPVPYRWNREAWDVVKATTLDIDAPLSGETVDQDAIEQAVVDRIIARLQQ